MQKPPPSADGAAIALEDAVNRAQYYRDRSRLLERIAYTREKLLRYHIAVLRSAIFDASGTAQMSLINTNTVICGDEKDAAGPSSSLASPSTVAYASPLSTVQSVGDHEEKDHTRLDFHDNSPESPRRNIDHSPKLSARPDSFMNSFVDRIRPRSMDLGPRPLNMVHSRGGSSGHPPSLGNPPWWRGIFRRASHNPSSEDTLP